MVAASAVGLVEHTWAVVPFAEFLGIYIVWLPYSAPVKLAPSLAHSSDWPVGMGALGGVHMRASWEAELRPEL